ncbi:MAG: cytochrome c3 family protein, partial [Actinomycetes bacterium]
MASKIRWALSRPGWTTILAAAAVATLALLPVVAFAFAPQAPLGLDASPGSTQPVVASLTWNPAAEAVSYSIWASTAQNGPFKPVGSTETTGFDFTDGLGGVRYYFRVSAFNADGESPKSGTVGPVTAKWVSDPHTSATTTTNKCASCHIPHAAQASPLLRTEVATDAPGQSATCMTCHDGAIAVAGNVATGTKDSFALASGHVLDTAVSAGGLTSDCASCHQPHGDADKNPMIPQSKINGAQVSSNGTAWCFACHDDSNSWFPNPSTYPTASAPQRNAAGYPISGTWLGQTAYNGAGNAHSLIPETTQTVRAGQEIRRDRGDCLYCHAAHRGPNAYDGLLATYRPTTPPTVGADQTEGDYAELCFTCHGGVTPSGFTTAPVDIKSIVTSTGAGVGHRIKTSGGVLPVGAPLPCYECHNPHGSTRGNDSMISDERGGSLTTTGSPNAVRQFCFTCHTTPGTLGTAKGWDSAAATYTAVAAEDKIVGILRYGGGAIDGVLDLPDISGHRLNDTASCYGCHGKSYSAGGNNVHSPGAGSVPNHTSPTSDTCFGVGCHDSSKDLAAVHALYAGPGSEYPQYATSCELCHENTNPDRINWATATATCAGVCHSLEPHQGRTAGHALTSASTECVSCHGSDLQGVHGALPSNSAKCATCHASKSNWSKSGDCLGCHNGIDVGTHVYTPVDPNHYGETTHTAIPFTAAYEGTGADGEVPAGGKECSTCHSATLNTAHSKTSTSGGSVTCVECHTDLSLGGAAVIAGGWPTRRCTDCHDTGGATTHGSYATTHTVEPGSCAGTGASCHNFTDLSQLHAAGQSGGAPKYQSCSNADPNDPTACHSVLDTRPAAFNPAASCGSDGTGCHQEKTTTNHGSATAHTFSAASDYDNATVAGCTNSGSGCHGTDATHANFASYHPAAGCLAGPCHTSPSKGEFTSTSQSHECVSCHDNGYTGAPDVVALAAASPNGHYNETTHTASGLDATVSSGGSASATCATCHDPSPASGLKGLVAQHTNITRIADSPYGTTIACVECHNDIRAGGNAEVLAKWTNNTCADCHKIGSSAPQHSATAPVVDATSSESCGASGTNCHTTYDVHALHKNAAGGCTLTGCHDATKQGLKPTTKTCGQVGGCHATYTSTTHAHASDAALHAPTNTAQASATFAGNTCGACHVVAAADGGLDAEHALATSAKTGNANVCLNCHNNAASTTAIANSWSAKDTTAACSSCHTATLAIHADANSTAHTKTNTGCGNSGAGCHPTGDLSQVGAPSTTANIHSTCLRCHDRAGAASWTSALLTTPGNLKWNATANTCGAATGCHPSTYYSTSSKQHRIGSADVVTGDDAAHH